MDIASAKQQIKNTVQIYLQKPYIEGNLEKASVELAGFTKTKLLQPGESETVRVTVNGEFFRTYDAVDAQTYVLDPGDYYLAAGYNAHDALNNIQPGLLSRKHGWPDDCSRQCFSGCCGPAPGSAGCCYLCGCS